MCLPPSAPCLPPPRQIVVLEGGHVVEQGSHKALMRAGGRYAALVSAQELTLSQTIVGTP